MRKILLLSLLLCAPRALAGEGEVYIPAYNELATMIVDRHEVVGAGITLPLKDPASEDPALNSVTQRDMDLLRALTQILMRDYYIAYDHIDPHAASIADAFPRRAALIMGSDIGKDGIFTLMPKRFTTTGVAHYANTMGDDVPLLWLHFMELYETLKRLNCTLRGGSWTAKGEANERSSYCLSIFSTFDDAQNCVVDQWNTSQPVSVDQVPGAYIMGRFWETQGLWSQGYSAGASSGYSYLRLDNLPGRECVATFTSYCIGDEWDACGADVSQDRWQTWCMVRGEADTSLTSTVLGNTERPAWCDEPAAVVGAMCQRGYGVVAALAIMEWTDLYMGYLVNPEEKDTVSDGICDTGCDACSTGDCLPGLHEGFAAKFRDAHVRFPLGLSSGLANNDIRVKAYISERSILGEPRQFFSLDTAVQMMVGGGGTWAFAMVYRPSGVPVLFSMSGDAPGLPAASKLGYRLKQVGAEYDLEFPDKRKTVHHFNSLGMLVQVRRTENYEELSLNGHPLSWPGLSVSRSSTGAPDYVSTTSVNALCDVSDDNLVTSVAFYDRKDERMLRGLDLKRGSRILRERDGDGNVIDETRIYTSHARQEIWYDVTTNGPLAAAKKTLREVGQGPGADEHTLLNTDILHPGAANEERAVTAVISRTFRTSRGMAPLRRTSRATTTTKTHPTPTVIAVCGWWSIPMGRGPAMTIMTRMAGSWSW